MRRMYAKHRHAWIYRSIRVLWRVWWAKPSDASDASRFARICLAPPTLVHLSTGATPQGNVAREDERCSDLSFEVDAARECRARRLESVVFDTLARLAAAAM